MSKAFSKAFMWGSVGITSTGFLFYQLIGGPKFEITYELALSIAYGIPINSLILANWLRKNEIKSFLQPAVENPEISTGVVNLSLSLPILLANPDNIIQYIGGPLVFSWWTNCFLNSLGKFNPPYVKNVLKSVIHNKELVKNLNNYKKLEELLLNQDIYNDPAAVYYHLASLEFEKQNPDFEKAIDYTLKGLEGVKKKNVFEKYEKRFISKILELLGINIKSELNKAFVDLYHENIKRFVKNLNKFVEEKPSIGSKSVRVFALEKVKNSKLNNKKIELETEKAWSSLLEEILNNESSYKSFETIEGKNVYVINSYEFIKKMLILKEGSYEELKKEIENLEFIKKKGLEVVEPIKIVEYDNKFFLAQKYANGETVSELFKKTRNFDLIRNCLRQLKKMQEIFPKNNLNNSFYKTIKKIQNSELAEEVKNLFLKNMYVIFKRGSTNLVFDCDAHLSNFISENAIILDKPSRGYIHAEEDVAKLCGREKIYDNVEDKINEIAEVYKNKDFAETTIIFTAPKAITYTIFELQTEIKYSPEFLENGIKDLEYAQKSKKYSKKEIKSFEEIKKGLFKFQSMVA